MKSREHNLESDRGIDLTACLITEIYQIVEDVRN